MSNFTFRKIWKPLNATFNGQAYESTVIERKNKNIGVGVGQADTYMKNVMSSVYKQHDGLHKYQVVYRLSDGEYYSSKFFGKEEQFVHPDFFRYGLDMADLEVEQIMVHKVKVVQNTIVQKKSKAGGCNGSKNDCLFNSIKFGLADKAEMCLPVSWYL